MFFFCVHNNTLVLMLINQQHKHTTAMICKRFRITLDLPEAYMYIIELRKQFGGYFDFFFKSPPYRNQCGIDTLNMINFHFKILSYMFYRVMVIIQSGGNSPALICIKYTLQIKKCHKI